MLLATGPDEFAGSFKGALEQAGCEVEMATTGEEVLAAVAGPFELIFLDLDLPDVDAMAVLEHIGDSKGPTAPPVVLLKGEGEPSHVVQRGLDLGASGYVLKHRVPRSLPRQAIADLFRRAGVRPEGAPNRRSPTSRPDGCQFSATLAFESCPAFLPLASGARATCSHLRIGTVDTWRLYPRCAIGDETARARYIRDQTA